MHWNLPPQKMQLRPFLHTVPTAPALHGTQILAGPQNSLGAQLAVVVHPQPEPYGAQLDWQI